MASRRPLSSTSRDRARPRALLAALLLLLLLLLLLITSSSRLAWAHAGPPFPIVEDRVLGPYKVSVWTDPDATDDGSAGGRFWIMVGSSGSAPVPADTRVSVSARSLEAKEPGAGRTATAAPGKQNEFLAALVLDREGRWEVRTVVEGGLGSTTVTAAVDATYDLRPSPLETLVYLLPFAAVGGFWLKAVLRRRGGGKSIR
jgi:hypothetical protein